MRCNLCSSSDHTFRSCPQSYANRARQSTSTADTLFRTIAEAQPPPDGLDSSNLTQTQVIPEQTKVKSSQEPTNSQDSIETCISQDLQIPHLPLGVAPESKKEDGMRKESRNEDNPEAEELLNQPALPSTEHEGTIEEVLRQLQEELPAAQPRFTLAQDPQPDQDSKKVSEESSMPSINPGDCERLRHLLDLGLQDMSFPGGTENSFTSSSTCDSTPPPKKVQRRNWRPCHKHPRGRDMVQFLAPLQTLSRPRSFVSFFCSHPNR